ncbi:MAG: hypothetical protein OXM55_06400, partial [Bdellovibrionales bacterium]|nr:hypothetical protein [Bdellovibrionales bacterium]
LSLCPSFPVHRTLTHCLILSNCPYMRDIPTPALGIAAEKGYWNLDSDKLKPLSDFLKELDCEH